MKSLLSRFIFYLWRACAYACKPLHLGPRRLPKSPQMLLMNIPRSTGHGLQSLIIYT